MARKYHPEIAQKPTDSTKRRSKAEQEAIYQTYIALDKNELATSRAVGMSYTGLRKLIRRFESKHTPQELIVREQKIEDQLLARNYKLVNDVIDSIKPEDLESGRIPIYDKEGKLAGYKEFGPSVAQKGILFGIGVDKIKVQKDMARAVGEYADNGMLMLPDNADQLVRMIQGRVASLSLVNVKFKDDHQDLTTRIDQALQVEAEVVASNAETIDFDNP